MRVSQQIGWSQESKLIYNIIKQLQKLEIVWDHCCTTTTSTSSTTTTTTTLNPGLTMAVAPNSRFDIPAQDELGTGNFTIEWWAKMADDSGHPRAWSVGSWPHAVHAVSIENNGTVYYWIDGGIVMTVDISGKSEEWLGVWAAFAIARNGNNISFYLNGNLEGQVTYTGSISSNGLPLYIGSEGNDSVMNTLMSNFRWTNIDLCGPGYSPSPVPLSPLPETKLLILQGDSLPLELTDNSGVTPPNIIANAIGIYNAETPFPGYPGSIQFTNLIFSGNWYLIDAFETAQSQGQITFPNNLINQGSVNPNLIGNDGVELFINPFTTAGDNYTTFFENYLVEKDNIIILKQVTQTGSNYVQFAVTNQCIRSCVNVIAYSQYSCASFANSITLLSPSSGNFNTIDPIEIYIPTTI